MKFLISGTTGFIGNHLTKRLRQEGHSFTAIVRPSTDIEHFKKENIPYYIFDNDIAALTAFMQQEQFDGVIHLASLFLAQHKPEDIRALIDSNVFFSTALLEAASKTTPWFINTGTFWQHYNNQDYSPVNLYAATKQAFESMAQFYSETTPINFVTIKLNDTFGPQDTRSKVFNLWMKISKSQEPLDMSPGEQIMDISYIDNVIDGYIQMITLLSKDSEKKLNGQSFALSAQERKSLKELAKIFEHITNISLPINWGKRNYRPREVMMPWNKGNPIPGWKQQTSLEDGIKKTFNE